MATHTAVVNHQLTTDIGQGVGFERTRRGVKHAAR